MFKRILIFSAVQMSLVLAQTHIASALELSEYEKCILEKTKEGESTLECNKKKKTTTTVKATSTSTSTSSTSTSVVSTPVVSEPIPEPIQPASGSGQIIASKYVVGVADPFTLDSSCMFFLNDPVSCYAAARVTCAANTACSLSLSNPYNYGFNMTMIPTSDLASAAKFIGDFYLWFSVSPDPNLVVAVLNSNGVRLPISVDLIGFTGYAIPLGALPNIASPGASVIVAAPLKFYLNAGLSTYTVVIGTLKSDGSLNVLQSLPVAITQ